MFVNGTTILLLEEHMSPLKKKIPLQVLFTSSATSQRGIRELRVTAKSRNWIGECKGLKAPLIVRIVENVTHWTSNTVRNLGKFTVVCDHDKRKSAFSLVRETQASTEGNDSRIIYGTTK